MRRLSHGCQRLVLVDLGSRSGFRHMGNESVAAGSVFVGTVWRMVCHFPPCGDPRPARVRESHSLARMRGRTFPHCPRLSRLTHASAKDAEMPLHIHHHHHHSFSARDEVLRRLDALRNENGLILDRQEIIMATMDDLKAAVTRNTSVDDSVL